ncbi:alpha/beta fold hydrolase [Roseisolibacter sp. H3M3-2]|uniref:alpha/beta fold hydrolase n=1 Tax=Roseisolibacter sp. H3M3-2 TaxID=3031323 RepID=UPI0023DC3DED|nr:alpha/beta fold hydrolase [Roseisolibacter sp. H3M3-2]MDF1503179.1 alpha/beta fold hydrolase [Roseisolibacter sp. H3M3-2]
MTARRVLAAAAALALACARPAPQPSVVARDVAVRAAMTLRAESRGSGPAVVLVHGGLVDARMWDAQVGDLARDHRVVRYDLRGAGRSSPAVEGWSHVDDLHAVLDTLGVARATLVGLSLGGAVATEYALAHPDRVSGLVLVGAPVRGVTVPPAPGPDLPAVARADSARAVRLLLDSAGVGAADPAPRPALAAMFAANLRAWSAVDPRWTRWPEPPAGPRLGELRVPTLVLVGTRDAARLDAFADALAERLPGAERDSLVGAQHHPNVEQPAAFNAIVRRFLARHGL